MLNQKFLIKEITRTTDACPTQWRAKCVGLDDNKTYRLYIRYRFKKLTVEIYRYADMGNDSALIFLKYLPENTIISKMSNIELMAETKHQLDFSEVIF